MHHFFLLFRSFRLPLWRFLFVFLSSSLNLIYNCSFVGCPQFIHCPGIKLRKHYRHITMAGDLVASVLLKPLFQCLDYGSYLRPYLQCRRPWCLIWFSNKSRDHDEPGRRRRREPARSSQSHPLPAEALYSNRRGWAPYPAATKRKFGVDCISAHLVSAEQFDGQFVLPWILVLATTPREVVGGGGAVASWENTVITWIKSFKYLASRLTQAAPSNCRTSDAVGGSS